MSKTDAKLGQEIHRHLMSKGVETPTIEAELSKDDKEKRDIIKQNVYNIMVTLGLDMDDDSLCDTPDRVAKMYVNEIFSGLNYDNFPKCTTVDNKMAYDEMVVEKDITCISACEHHLITIDQKATIAYIPGKKVLGLSKLNRIAKFFAQRPQIQERFTEQLYYALCYILGTDDVAVLVHGKHYCVAARGVEDASSYTVTSKLGGTFKDNQTARAEFLSLARK